jgi:hypothetical protein
MKAKDILGILGVAAATTAFTVVLLGPAQLAATDNPQAITPRILQPTLLTQGCVLALKTDKAVYKPGEMPVLRIEATNPTSRPVETTVWPGISASTPPSPMARTLAPPKQLWSEKCIVKLDPGKTMTVTLPTNAKLPEGAQVSITISDKDLTVLARAFSTPNTALAMQAGS